MHPTDGQPEMHPTDAAMLLATEGGWNDLPGNDGLAGVRAHLARCERCAERLRRLEAELATTIARFAVLDDGPVEGDVEAVIERARRGEESRGAVPARSRPPLGPAPPPPAAGRGVGSRHPLRTAAVVTLLLAAGAAAAIPGSPARRWIASLVAPGSEVSLTEQEGPTPTPRPGGFAFTLDGPLEIVLPATVRRGAVLLRWGDEARVRVRSSDPETRFSLAPGVLTLGTALDSLEVEVVMPAAVEESVTVRAGDRDLLSVPAGEPSSDSVRVQIGTGRPSA